MASTRSLAVCVLLGLLAVAASQAERQGDAKTQYYKDSQTYHPKPHKYDDSHSPRSPPADGDYYPDTVTHKDYTFVLEEQEIVMPENETVPVGTTLVRTAALVGHSEMIVGTVVWTGAAYSLGHNPVKDMAHWLVTFDIKKDEWEGKVIAAGPGTRPSSPHAKEWAVLGGSGMYEGATGKITWTSNKKYTFEITLRPHKDRVGYVAAQAQIQSTGLPGMQVTA